MFSGENIEHGGSMWHAGTERRKQGFFLGAKVGDEVIVEETDRIFSLLLRTVRRLPVAWQPLAQPKGQDQTVVMIVRERNEAGVAFGRHKGLITYPEETGEQGMRYKI